MYLLNGSKSYYSNPKGTKVRAKKYRFIFFYDEDGHFHKQRVSIFQYFFKKYFCKKAHLATCMFCYEKYATYSKHSISCGLCNKE